MTACRRVIRCILALALLCACGYTTSLSAQTTKLEVRLAEEWPGAGLVEAQVPNSGRHIYLYQSPVVTNADVNDARVLPAGTGFNVAVTFTPQGAEKIATATQAHVGRPLAILLNGKVIAAPTLRDPIRQDALLTGDWTKQQADEIATGLNGR